MSTNKARNRSGGDMTKNIALSEEILLVLFLLLSLCVYTAFNKLMFERKQDLPVLEGGTDVVKKRAVKSNANFLSFLDFEGKPYQVSYNAQAILLNGVPSLLLGGSVHPTRAAGRRNWEEVLDQAVDSGLNLITIYVFWSAHQPFQEASIDWSLPYSHSISDSAGGSWDLAEAIKAIGERGMFLHIRLGPYTCAEYSYGGIPEWLQVVHPNITMRHHDPLWMDLMEGFIKTSTEYLTKHKLWAHQGGPIILGQVENELGSDQPYADWCGEMVEKVAPTDVVWTMCNGLSAKNTIQTYNGMDGVSWLKKNGGNGRVQIDQPALFTEAELGFQLWGIGPDYYPQNKRRRTPDNLKYMYGVTGRSAAKDALRWVARGGNHFNWYMFYGGYNRGRAASANVMNAYAADGIVCPSGEPRQPKFGHFQRLHKLLASISPLLFTNDSPPAPTTIEIQDEQGQWITGEDQVAFVYKLDDSINGSSDTPTEAVFVENNGADAVMARLSFSNNATTKMKMDPFSAVLLVDRKIAFDSSKISPHATGFQRKVLHDAVPILEWDTFQEKLLSMNSTKECHEEEYLSPYPMEQTSVNHRGNGSSLWTDYARFGTVFELSEDMTSPGTLIIDTDYGMSLLAYLSTGSASEKVFQSSAAATEHAEGKGVMHLPISKLQKGRYELTFISESLGYNKLLERWGGHTPKRKGITGNVTLVTSTKNYTLTTNETQWCSLGGLYGEMKGLDIAENEFLTRLMPDNSISSQEGDGPHWTRAKFATPKLKSSDQRLYLDITHGRGHIWLNGHDLGRYWNITKAGSWQSDGLSDDSVYSQRYYHLPEELLEVPEGSLNELTILDVFGQHDSTTDHDARITVSWIEPSSTHEFEDVVGYPDSCLL